MRFLLFFILLFKLPLLNAQPGAVYFYFQGEYTFEHPILTYSAFTSNFDELDRPYIYSACIDLGLVVFNYDTTGFINPVDTLLPSAFSGLKPTNVFQVDNHLFVSLGSYAGLFPQNAGLAIVNIEDPENLIILSQWDSAIFNQGSAVVTVNNDYAFLGAMEKGIVALDVSDPLNPFFTDSVKLDPNFPDIPGLFTTPNTRGMAMYGDDYLIVCNDHGGLRKIDVSNLYDLLEVGKYMNWDLYSTAAPAYNNVVIKNNIAYATVDYCGMDVIQLDTETMQNILWYNPWNCNFDNWDGNQGHSNGIVISSDEKFLFMSGGDSEVLAFNITVADTPVFYGQYAFPFDSIVAWSLDVHDNFVSLALVDNSVFGTPYYSDIGGIQLLRWDAYYPTHLQTASTENIQIFPNPASQYLWLSFGETFNSFYYEILDMGGDKLHSGYQLQNIPIAIEDIPSGIYYIKIIYEQQAPLVKTFSKI